MVETPTQNNLAEPTMAQRNLIGLDKQTNTQTFKVFIEPITLSFRKGNIIV
jgi:hypothetical protein